MNFLSALRSVGARMMNGLPFVVPMRSVDFNKLKVASRKSGKQQQINETGARWRVSGRLGVMG